MKTDPINGFSRRERQIMNIVYSLESASVVDVIENMPDAPSYSAVRALMRILEKKGHLKHKKAGLRFIYSPTRPKYHARRTALKQLLKTFFDDSVGDAVAALLGNSDSKLSDDEIKRLSKLIRRRVKSSRY